MITMSTDVLEHLRDVELFRSLDGPELQGLAAAGSAVTHPPGEEVDVDRGTGVGFHLVLDGEAVLDVGGGTQPILTRGDSFGELSLLDGLPRTFSVTAGPAGLVTFALTSWAFGTLLDAHPRVARCVIAELCARIRVIEQAAVRARAAVAVS